MMSGRAVGGLAGRPVERLNSGEVGMALAAMATSKSLTNLPLVTVTDTDVDQQGLRPSTLCARLLDGVPTHSRSHPCSPQLKRKAFTTFVGGMRYIIGKKHVWCVCLCCGCLYVCVCVCCVFVLWVFIVLRG